MTITNPLTARLSEQWLLERTYHAFLHTGRELSVPALTLAMKQLTDCDVPRSSQSATSKLPERSHLQKSTSFYVPLSAWKEISQEEAYTLSHQRIPILLYGEHAWKHPKGAAETWRPNRNMRRIIYRDAEVQPEAVSGTDYAVCYSDPQQGTFSNTVWKALFASDAATMLEGGDHDAITFFAPWVQFPSTTHYTVIAADGQIREYATSTEAVQGFQTLPPREVSKGSQVQTVFPQFCYYHEVTCPSGIYRIEFFGPCMDERGYQVKEAA